MKNPLLLFILIMLLFAIFTTNYMLLSNVRMETLSNLSVAQFEPLPSILIVAFDYSHHVDESNLTLSNQHRAQNLGTNLTTAESRFNAIEGRFTIPGGTNVLLISNSNMSYTSAELNNIYNWFNSGGARLLWIAGDSDYGGLYNQGPNNEILAMIGANLRISADAVEDPVNNDNASYRVAVQTPVSDGALNSIFTTDVSSVIMHGPTSVLGYQNSAIVDLAQTSINDIEIVMKTSPYARALDQDLSTNELDYYSSNNINGSYPMMAIQTMGNHKSVVVSGEAIFSDYKHMYDALTEQGTINNPNAWNNGFHDGKILVDNVLTWFGKEVTASEELPNNLAVAYEYSHHVDESNFTFSNQHRAENLRVSLISAGSIFNAIGETFTIPGGTNVLLISNSNMSYTSAELNSIYNWFYSYGARLLWIAGDSDYGGLYNQGPNNEILATVGANLRISADAVEDPVNNDNASYRVAVQTPVSDGALNSIFTTDVSSVIMHGPTSVLGYQNSAVVDLAQTSINDIEIVMKTSPHARALDQDLSANELDYYSSKNINGSYPMMAIQTINNHKSVIVSGEVIFSDYKYMYDILTEQGAINNPNAWNNGLHDGKTLVDNILTWFGEEVTASETTTTEEPTQTTTLTTESTTTTEESTQTTTLTTEGSTQTKSSITSTTTEESSETPKLTPGISGIILVFTMILFVIFRRRMRS